MTDQDADRKKGFESLLVERKKFETWLVQLEAKRSAASPHVFERVFADYAKRRDDVLARLRGEADSLQALVSDMEARHARDQDKVAKKSDERAEAELRAMVGELSEKEWSSTRSKLDASIADLRAKLAGTERELAELKELLLHVSGAPDPAPGSVKVAAAAMGTVTSSAPDVLVPLSVSATAEVTAPVVESVEAPAPAMDPKSEAAPMEPPAPSAPRSSQPVRSLKCGECGTLNFPTEWYCERCGGELAAF